MAWTLDQIITGRRDRLLTQFARGSLMPVVEVDDRAKLASLMHLGEFPKGGLPGNLGGRQPQNVSVVAATAHDPHAGSVWVRGFEYAGYRDAYLEFLKVSYGLTVSASQFSREYDVDHLLNRAQTGSEVALHRVEALPSWINRLWGSYLEKLASFRKLDPDDPEKVLRTTRKMSYLIAAKTARLLPPARLDDATGRERLALGLIALGLPGDEVRSGLANMLDHIARNQS